MSYGLLAEAGVAVRDGALYVATNSDSTLPTPRGPQPGNGSLLQVIITATGVQPVVAGKPRAAAARRGGRADRGAAAAGGGRPAGHRHRGGGARRRGQPARADRRQYARRTRARAGRAAADLSGRRPRRPARAAAGDRAGGGSGGDRMVEAGHARLARRRVPLRRLAGGPARRQEPDRADRRRRAGSTACARSARPRGRPVTSQRTSSPPRSRASATSASRVGRVLRPAGPSSAARPGVLPG